MKLFLKKKKNQHILFLVPTLFLALIIILAINRKSDDNQASLKFSVSCLPQIIVKPFYSFNKMKLYVAI